MTEADKRKKMINEGPFIIFHVEGGLGKCILSTAVVEVIAKTYPNHKIIVVTAWEAAFLHNPHVERVYNFKELNYFFDQYIFSDTKIFRQEVYHTEDYVLHKKHLIKAWCDMYGLPYNGEQPRIYLNPREIEVYANKYGLNTGKPIMIIQTNGGAPNQPLKKSWARDLPIHTAQQVVNYFSKDYRVMHIRREDQFELQNVETLLLNQRELFVAIVFSKKRLFIDSFAQHAAKALGLDSVVCWIGTKPEVFGYENNINILPCVEPTLKSNKFSYIEEFDISGQVNQYPYNTLDIFNAQEIIDSLSK